MIFKFLTLLPCTSRESNQIFFTFMSLLSNELSASLATSEVTNMAGLVLARYIRLSHVSWSGYTREERRYNRSSVLILLKPFWVGSGSRCNYTKLALKATQCKYVHNCILQIGVYVRENCYKSNCSVFLK